MARPEQLLLALIGEAAIGYPAALFAAIGHPVTWIGAGIAALERGGNRG
ncbi:MAG: cobalamin biosynthesis protein CobD, partial [Sphingobium sp.]|nr:cobalamin biosynthesis protein CobD [Sphingobium sp.]